jgi:hypothetical protein
MKPKRWKPQREDTNQVQIDGQTQSWGQFKRNFEQEIVKRAKSNDQVKYRQFKLN